MATAPNSKNQHYVWQHYLNAWGNGGTFCCYRQKDRQLLLTQPKSVASETYFYEMQRLTVADRKFLEAIIGRAADEGLRKLNSDYVKLTQLPFELRALLEDERIPADVRTDVERELRWAERNLGEKYHNGIENKCQDILDSLRAKNTAFYQTENRCVDFLYYLSLQYFRTPKMRAGIGRLPSDVTGHDPRRTAGILNHIYATNLGASLFRERQRFQIVFLQNATSIPFITGDQPVINMLDPKKTDDVELYYPLSPNLAMLLTKDADKSANSHRSLIPMEVEHYNYRIFSRSEDQVYSDQESYLLSLVTLSKSLLIE